MYACTTGTHVPVQRYEYDKQTYDVRVQVQNGFIVTGPLYEYPPYFSTTEPDVQVRLVPLWSRHRPDSQAAARGCCSTHIMAGINPSLGRAHELLQELRLGIRRIEVVEPGSRDENDHPWTRNAIEVQQYTAGTQSSCGA